MTHRRDTEKHRAYTEARMLLQSLRILRALCVSVVNPTSTTLKR
jgi:hypothetical protein